MTEDFLLRYWQQLVVFAGFVVWLARLEAGMKRNREELTKLSATVENEQRLAIAHRSSLTAKLDAVSASIGGVEANVRELRSDIKHILEKIGGPK